MNITDFWGRVLKSEGCWLWTGSKTSAGYGNLRWQGRHDYAHRVAYRLTIGAIPEGLVLDHLCRVRNCVRPDHLEPVRQAVNVARGIAPYGVRTQCKHGHDITDEANVYVGPNGQKRCRVCAKALNASRTAARRAARAA